MTIDKALIAALLLETPVRLPVLTQSQSEALAEYLAGKLAQVAATRERIWKLRQEVGLAEKLHAEEMSALRKQIRDVEEECPHWTTTPHAQDGKIVAVCDVCGRSTEGKAGR